MQFEIFGWTVTACKAADPLHQPDPIGAAYAKKMGWSRQQVLDEARNRAEKGNAQMARYFSNVALAWKD